MKSFISKLRQLILNIGISLLSLLLVIATIEVFYRVTKPHQLSAGTERSLYSQYDSEIGWVNKPNKEGMFVGWDFDTHVSINSKGLRDKEYDYEKPVGVKRILVLGDSFTWGYGVEYGERYTDILENQFENVEIINLGTSGYGTDQELLLFYREGLKYDPDLTLLAFHLGTDLYNNASSFQYEYHKPVYKLNGDKLDLLNVPVPKDTLSQKIHKWLMSHSYIWRYHGRRRIKGKAIYNWLLEGYQGLVGEVKAPVYEDFEGTIPVSCSLIWGIADMAHDNNSEFMTMIIPQVEMGSRRILDSEFYGLIRRCVSKRGLNAVDLQDPFFLHIENHPDQPVVFEHDAHWNKRGHELAAEHLKPQIEVLLND